MGKKIPEQLRVGICAMSKTSSCKNELADALGDSLSSDNCPAPVALLVCENKVGLGESEGCRKSTGGS